jgi:hypothetical protein
MPAKAKPHCRKGHLLSGENLYLWVSPKSGQRIRHCQICTKAYRRERYLLLRESQIASVQAWRRADPERTKRTDRKQALRRYGVTPEQYDELLANQSGGCAICCQPCVSGMRLAVDHDHETGVVRGLLCMKCNRGLGLFCDQENLLNAAISYLQRTNA